MKLIFSIMAGVFFALMGGTAAAAPLSAADNETVRQVERYLNGLGTMRADFIQVASGGRFAEGKIYLRRPDKMRIDYAPPATVQVYTTSWFLIYVDTELREVTHVPVDRTPAGFLVSDKIALSGELTVSQVTRGKGTVHLHIFKTQEPEAGKLVLSLATDPMQLRQWTVTDGQGVETKFSLISPAFGVKIPDEIFQFDSSKYEEPVRD